MSLRSATINTNSIASVDEIIEEARQGRMFILTDDENRENEGDLIIAAQFAKSETINFIRRHTSGIICLPMASHLIDRLQLPMMVQNNQSRYRTPFTSSIEAREGVTTGVSAADRAHTIRTAVDPTKGPQDIVSPGHIFPLKADDGGVLARPGHTEGCVDIMRLAGLIPAAVLCEVTNEDGTMARLPDLIQFAETHQMKIGTIADLVTYRQHHKL